MRFISKWIAATVTWIATSLANQPVMLATMMAGHIPPANPDLKLKPFAIDLELSANPDRLRSGFSFTILFYPLTKQIYFRIFN